MRNSILEGRGICALALLLVGGSAFAASVAPVTVTGVNVTSCVPPPQGADNSLNTALRIAGAGYTQDAPNWAQADAVGVITAPDGVAQFSVTFDSETHTFSWQSLTPGVGVDAIAVKGGNGANIYVYDPTVNGQDDESRDATSDSGVIPISNCGDGPGCLSHLGLCYEYHLLVSKTANGSFDRTFPWSLAKTAAPAALNLFNGDSGDVIFTVTATKGAPIDTNFAVSGTVTISNPAPYAASITGITDQLDDGTSVSLSCATGTLAAFQSESCDYSSAASGSAGGSRTNTVSVSTGAPVGGGSAAATATFGAPANVFQDTLSVGDSAGAGPWTFGGTSSVQYSKTFDCSAQGARSTFAYGFDNVASASNPTASATAHVDVNCYSLAVSKTALTSFNRVWNWSIGKVYTGPAPTVDTNGDGTPDALLLSSNQSVQLGYNVNVAAVAQDTNFGVAGTITVSNNDPARDASLGGVTDVLAPGVLCPSLTVPAGGALTCTYAGSLPNADSTINVATATQQNFHYAADGGATAAGTTSYSGSTAVVFGAPSALIDTCATIADAFNGAAPAGLGTLCATSLSWSKTLSYSIAFTWDPSLGTCKTLAAANVASFATADTHGTGSSTATINLTNQDCVLGCTLTQGYWKTHGKYGPAKNDPVWNQIQPGGADSPFFYSGSSWYVAFWTPPAGNAYWVLAHQYAAAVLNGFSGASEPPQVQTAVNTAFALFNDPKNTPAYIAGLKNNSALRAQFVSLAALLDMYNNGQYPGGPAHCTEDSSSAP